MAERNLRRGWRLGPPFGQAVDRGMELEPLADKEILIGKGVDAPDEPLRNIVSLDKAFAKNCR